LHRKTHVVKELDRSGFFPLHSFVSVDPDYIRHTFLPEFDWYVQQCPELAGERTRKETGMIAEILAQAALQKGQNVLVDGTLRDAEWYREYFQDLRVQHPNIKIAILHIVAPRETVFERAEVCAMCIICVVSIWQQRIRAHTFVPCSLFLFFVRLEPSKNYWPRRTPRIARTDHGTSTQIDFHLAAKR
jgi:hypothetical protein